MVSARTSRWFALALVSILLAVATIVVWRPSQGDAAETWGAVAITGSSSGYVFVTADGAVVAGPGATAAGSMAGTPLSQPIVGMASTPSGAGYWFAAADGGVFSFGDATFLGSMGGTRLNKPIVGMAATPSGRGYWLVASDGGVFTFGDAGFYGSTGSLRLNQPVVGIASSPSGRGYWLVASDGGVFSFGDAAYQGSTGAMRLNQPVVGIAGSPQGGYWLAASDGGIFTFGRAAFHGAGLHEGVRGITATRSGGYRTLDALGAVASFEPGAAPTVSAPVLSAPVATTTTPSGGSGGSGSGVTGAAAPPAATARPVAGDVFASPSGNGNGTEGSPASLNAVLSGSVRVAAGRTIWLRGGTYQGRFASDLSGTSSGRITVRSYPGEWAVLSSNQALGGDVLQIRGRYTDVRDIEITMSATNRSSARDAGVSIQGDNNRLINTFIHDTGCGVTSFSQATNVEIYGNILLNIGSTDHGVSCYPIYAANNSGSTKLIEDNVWYGQFSYGLHLYTTNGALRNITLRGNVMGGENLVGGEQPVDGLVLDRNDIEVLRMGYGSRDGAATITGNRIGWNRDEAALRIETHWGAWTFTGNTLLGYSGDGVRIENQEGWSSPFDSANWNGNQYYNTGFAWPARAGDWPATGVNFAAWKAAHPGFDTTSTWRDGTPPDSVVVRANRYEPTRATVIAHTYSGASTIAVDPSAVLARGQRYEVRNAFNYGAGAIASGTWNGGTISLTTSTTLASPLGASQAMSEPDPNTTVYVLFAV
jgi:hypothetical protein